MKRSIYNNQLNGDNVKTCVQINIISIKLQQLQQQKHVIISINVPQHNDTTATVKLKSFSLKSSTRIARRNEMTVCGMRLCHVAIYPSPQPSFQLFDVCWMHVTRAQRFVHFGSELFHFWRRWWWWWCYILYCIVHPRIIFMHTRMN